MDPFGACIIYQSKGEKISSDDLESLEFQFVIYSHNLLQDVTFHLEYCVQQFSSSFYFLLEEL